MRRLLSYLYPITKKVLTDNNGVVEVTLYNGRKLLDSKNANYSYGSVQGIMTLGLKQIDLSKIDSVLLLGLGGGSAVQTLRKDFNYTNAITAVEFDKVIIDIALNEFNLTLDNKLEIHHADAFAFVKDCKQQFNLTIVDLFIDDKVPEVFYSREFWKSIFHLTTENGYIIFNASLTSGATSLLPQFTNMLDEFFSVQQFDRVEKVNTLIVGNKLSSKLDSRQNI